ncbi:MAG: hypothetical protein KJ063_04010 [Anaerolineae bacterium]|nr:hypothetical protein [Anaerolineae bacterium]
MYELALNMGAKVHCLDGECGKLAKVTLEPDTFVVTHLIVEEGFLLKRARVFPILLVEQATPEDIYLNVMADELADYPEYREEIVEIPDPNHSGEALLDTIPYMTVITPPMLREKMRQGIPEDATVIERGIPVRNSEGSAGKLDGLVIEQESGQISQVVMQQGLVFTEQKFIPAVNVQHIGERAIAINI